MRKLLLFLFIFLSFQNIFSQGLTSIYSTFSQNVIAVGKNGKVLRSTNAGAGWELRTFNSAVNFTSVSSSASDYLITADNGSIYKVGITTLAYTVLNTPVITPLNSIWFSNQSFGFVCGNAGVVLKSTNYGINWAANNSGVSLSSKLNSISFRDSLNGITVGDAGVIYITTNGGNNWILQSSLTNKNLLSVNYYPDGIIITGEYGTIIKKNNAGSFELIKSRTVSDIRSNSGTFINNHICGGGGFIRNNKSSYEYLNFETNPMLAELSGINFSDSLTGYAISSQNDAVIKTTDGGINWNLPAGTTVNIQWVSKLTASNGIGNNLCMHPKDRNSMFVMYGNAVYVSRNKGENWSQIATTSLGTRAHSFYVNPLDTNIWMAAIESSTDKVIRSTDYGVTWNTILSLNFSNYGQPLEMDQNNPSVFYFAPDGGGFYKSIDTGKTFTEVSGNFPFLSPCDIMVMYDSSNVLFVADGVTGSGIGKIYKSVNSGVNWTLVHTNTSSSEIPSMSNTIFDKSIMYATNWSGGNIFRTTNFGDNWSLLRNNPSSGWASDICREDPTVVLTGSYGSPTFLSTNSGANFTSYTSGGGAGAGMIYPERNYAINMMTGGLYKLSISYTVLTDAKPITENLPSDFNLYQNFPNPFNPVTKIKFDLPKAGVTKITIYDNLGREVKNILNEYRNAGTYEIDFSASQLSSGIYFYRLTNGNFTQTKKMILIK